MNSDDSFVDDPLKDATRFISIVDLFAGIGGFHYGIGAAAADRGFGVRPLLVSEIEPSCRVVYLANHPSAADVFEGDINRIALSDFGGAADIVTAGFPCQPFSNSGRKRGLADPRGQFYDRIEAVIKHFGSKSFILENVPGMTKNGGGNHHSRLAAIPQTIGATMRTLEDRMLAGLADYEIAWLKIDSSHLGSPQVRKRVYIVGLHRDFGSLPNLHSVHRRSLPFISIAEKERIESLELNDNQESNIRRSMNSSSGPTYKDGMRRVGQAYTCPGGNVGQAYHAHGLVPTLTKVWARFLPIYFPHEKEAVPMIDSPDFTPTMPWYGMGYLRRASVREAMLLQGFPQSFRPHERDTLAYEHAGNAVNALVVKEIASALLGAIHG